MCLTYCHRLSVVVVTALTAKLFDLVMRIESHQRCREKKEYDAFQILLSHLHLIGDQTRKRFWSSNDDDSMKTMKMHCFTK